MSDPRLLILETSCRRGLIALAVGERIVGQKTLDERRRNARDLAPAIADLLRDQGLHARQLDGVLVSRGPGSYTGLRVGIMSAKTLAYAVDCALLAIDTFVVIAHQAPADCSHVEVIADAQQQNVYAQSFARTEKGWQATSELSIVPFTTWLAGHDPAAHVSGPGLIKWQAHLPNDVLLVPETAREPGVVSLLTLGLARHRNEERDDLFTVEPLYLRPSSAEEQWKGRTETRTNPT